MLRFCFGASGSGKSTTLFREVIEESQRSPETDFFIVVPDQFTLQVQRDVVRMHPKHAISNIDVLSFSRLRHRVFDEVGKPEVPVLDDMGKTLVLRHVADQIQDRLPVIGRRLSQPGFLDEVKSVLSEFLQYRITPADLDRLVEACGMHRQLAARLRDCRTVYDAFLSFLKGHYVTAEETLGILSDSIPRSKLLKDSIVVFDGFTGFTPIQYQVISSLLRTARQVTVSLLMDPQEDPFRFPRETDSVFSLTLKATADLEKTAYLASLTDDHDHAGGPDLGAFCVERRAKAGDLFLRERPVRRLRDNPPLAFLEESVFRRPSEVWSKPTGDSITLFEASDPEEECTECCLKIHSMLRTDETLRFENMAILTTDPESYVPLIKRTASLFDIPLYIDETRKLRMNPLVECIESAMAVLRDRDITEAAFRFLRCPILGLSVAAVDRLQIYTEALGIRRRKQWESRFLRTVWTDRTPEEQVELLQEVNELRERFCELIEPFAASAKGDVRTFSEALIALLENLHAEEKLLEIAAVREASGDQEGRREYEQVYRKVMELIDQMIALLGEQHVSVREYGELLRVGIDKITIGMIPASIDRVVIGDMERTRLGEKKILFLLGVNDTLLPRSAGGGGILNEMDRRFLSEAVRDVELAPDTVQSLSNEREYLYMNLTKPSVTLGLSWSLTGLDGKSMRPADLIRQIRRMFPELPVHHATERELTDRIGTVKSARMLVSGDLRRYADAQMTPEEERDYLTLVHVVCDTEQGKTDPVQRLFEQAFYTYRPSPIDKKTIDILYAGLMEGSVSRMETFAACPFSYFAAYGLRLRERERYEVDPTDLGTVYHGVLQGIDGRLRAGRRNLADLTAEETIALTDAVLTDYLSGYRNQIFLSNARYQYMQQRIRRVMLRTVDTLRYQLEKGVFVPAASEWDFRVQESGWTMRGRVDRIDEAGGDDGRYFRIVDYKSGAQTWDPALFYHGIQMQLVIYLRAVTEAYRKRYPETEPLPAGVFYYRVNDPILSGDDNKIASDIENQIRKELAFSGIANRDMRALSLMDRTLAGGGGTALQSDILPVGLKKDGAFTASSHVFSTEEFDMASQYAGKMIRSVGDRIRAGDVTVSPYRYRKKTACDYCRYRGVCSFDRQIAGYRMREITPMKEQDLLTAIRSERDV